MPPPTGTQKVRNSSIELYRIIATFTVLAVHFNGWFVGGMPEKFDLANPTSFRTGQMIIEAVTCICVNMFLLISGYFGIRLKLSSVITLCMLLVLIYVPFYLLEVLLGTTFSMKVLISKFLVISNAGYFIQDYVMLMFFSPVLNAFVKEYKKDILPWTITFLFIETWFGCIYVNDNFGFNKGYSIIHFVLIYMLARCIAMYKEKLLQMPRYAWLLGYLFSTAIICLMYILGLQCAFDYSNPVVVFSSVCTFVPFLYKEWYSKLVNWIAGGTLAVYIIQVTSPVHPLLVKVDNYILEESPYPVYLIGVTIVIIVTFCFSILYHRMCTILTGTLMKKISPAIKGIEMSIC